MTEAGPRHWGGGGGGRPAALLALALACMLAAGSCRARPPGARVVVEVGSAAGEVSPLLLGYNHLWPGGGQGILTGTPPRPDPAMIARIRDLGVTLLRYPGGTLSHTYRWRDGVGPLEERRPVPLPRFQNFGGGASLPSYGTDEFLALCEKVGAEPLVVVALDGGTPEEAAAWVAYLDARPGDDAPIGTDATGTDWKTAGHWARLRGANGHPEPYGVTWFEIGNEPDLERFPLTVEEYCDAFLAYRDGMKRVAPSIRLGAAGHDEPGAPGSRDLGLGTGKPWNKTLIARLGNRIDFLALHCYARHDARTDRGLDVLADPLLLGETMRKIRRTLGRSVPAGTIDLAVTEYATDLSGRYSPGKRGNATLRAALTVADSLFEMARAGVRLACVHVLSLDLGPSDLPFVHFASIRKTPDALVLEPDYHAVRLVARHLGPRLYRVRVESPTFTPSFRPSLEVPYVSVLATGDPSRGTLDLLLLNKHPARSIETTIEIRGAGEPRLRPQGGRILTGPGPDAGNDDAPRVEEAPLAIGRAGARMRVTLPPLSLVAIPLSAPGR